MSEVRILFGTPPQSESFKNMLTMFDDRCIL
nr:MAG TPA: hypothetical protein [Caudoviricetes sp.]